jgi:hypothetical protein
VPSVDVVRFGDVLVRSLVPSLVFVAPALIVFFAAACDRAAPSRVAATDAGVESPPTADSPSTQLDAGTELPCHLRPWSAPERTEISSTTLEEGAPSLTPDELAIVFHVRPLNDPAARYELRTATRASRDAPFSNPVRLTGKLVGDDDAYPTMTSDGMTLVFVSRRPDREGLDRLFRAERPELTVSFGPAEPIAVDAEVSAWPDVSVSHPFFTRDRSTLYFAADPEGSGVSRIYRSSRGYEFGPPVREESVDDARSSLAFVLSADHLTMYVSRRTEAGGYLIHSAARASLEEPFGPLGPVAALNAGAEDTRMGWLSPDGCRCWLTRRNTSGAAGDVDLYSSERR